MIETKYFCDKCKKETTYDAICNILIGFAWNPSQPQLNGYAANHHQSAQWCTECMREYSILLRRYNEEAKLPDARSTSEQLEEILREIAREEIANAANP